MRSDKLGEKDRVLTLYTRERGKLSAVAKGVRGAKSKLGGRMEPLAIVDVLLHEGKSLDVVNQADILMVLDKLRGDYHRMELAGKAVKLIRRSCHDQEPNPKLFNLLVRTLIELDEECSPAVLASFYLKYLYLSGYHPHMSVCVSCGQDNLDFVFSPGKGGLVCRECSDFGSDFVELSAPGRDALSFMLASPMVEARKAYPGSNGVVSEVTRCCEAMLKWHL